jgi:type VI protein secretion system component Hcp
MKKITAMLVLASGFLLAGKPATAADYLLLKLPGITGTSAVPGHPGEIDLLSFSAGILAPTKKLATTGCSDINVMKVTDQTSPLLFAHALFGIDFPGAGVVLTYNGPTPSGQADIYSLALTNVSITSVQESGSTGGGLPTEAVSLKATQWTATFNPPGGGAPVTQIVNCK